jgi:hypothetical protein
MMPEWQQIVRIMKRNGEHAYWCTITYLGLTNHPAYGKLFIKLI